MSFVYEVNLEVQQHSARAFEEWLVPHITEMLSFDGFVTACWYTRSPTDESRCATTVLWTIQYHLENRFSYEQYVKQHAARMRADGLHRFAGAFAATRRLLELKAKMN